jgi:hypothetical protein
VITEKELLNLADNMVSGATQMGSMGYETLINNREELKEQLYQVFQKIKVEETQLK